ncbi:unnamed protein product, partial [Rotaria sp. Silwood1]
KFRRPIDMHRVDININKDDLSTLKLSHERLVQNSLSPSRMSFHSPIVNMSKSVENLSIENDQRLIRPKSLLLDEQIKEPFDEYSLSRIKKKSSIENKNLLINSLSDNINSLRKTKSLHNVNKQEQYLPLNKSRTHLTNEQINIIEIFLK